MFNNLDPSALINGAILFGSFFIIVLAIGYFRVVRPKRKKKEEEQKNKK